MVVVPPSEFGDLLMAERTETVLLFPEREKLPFPLEVVYHFHVETLFKVHFPCWVIWVSLALNFHVPRDKEAFCLE